MSDNDLADQFRAGFDAAAAQWSSRFVDEIMLNYTIDVDQLGGGVLGQASSTIVTPSYVQVRDALILDQTSATDFSVAANLNPDDAIDIRTNDRAGDIIIDRDESRRNSFLRITRSNAKSLGLVAANAGGEDSSITFNESFDFDFDQSDGITSGSLTS